MASHYRVVEDDENGVALLWSLLWRQETVDSFLFGVKMVAFLAMMAWLTKVFYRRMNN